MESSSTKYSRQRKIRNVLSGRNPHAVPVGIYRTWDSTIAGLDRAQGCPGVMRNLTKNKDILRNPTFDSCSSLGLVHARTPRLTSPPPHKVGEEAVIYPDP
jgi:hypothetical protein